MKTLLLLIFSGIALAHGPAHSNDDLLRVTNVLEATFLAIETSDELVGDRPFQFVDGSGKVLYLSRLHLTEALISALSRLETDERCHLKGTRPAHCEHHHGWRERLTKTVRSIPSGIRRISGHSAEVARHYGIIPLVVVLATWLPYTAVTEILESFVVGPAHLWCTLSQMLYFGAIQKLALGGKILTEAAIHRDSQKGFWRRLGALASDSWSLANYRKKLSRVLVDAARTVVNRADYWRYSISDGDRNSVNQLFALSGLWMDYYANREGLSRSMTRIEKSDIDRVLRGVDSARLPVLAELVSGLELLASLVRMRISLLLEADKLSWSAYVGRMYRLGAWTARFETWQRSVMLSIREAGGGRNRLAKDYTELLSELKLLSGISCSSGLAMAGSDN